MKKYLFLFYVGIVCLLFGCSSDDTAGEPVIDSPAINTFNYSVNGEIIREDTLLNTTAKKLENKIIISLNPEIVFDIDGHLGYIKNVMRVPQGTSTVNRTFQTFADFSSNYFNWNVEVDQTTKRVKGNFSGMIYANRFKLDSETKFVTGDFDLPYEDVAPSISGIKNQATIGGNAWSASNSYVTKDVNNANYITQHDVSDNEYKIMVKYGYGNISGVGTYNFTSTDPTNQIQLAKFNPASKSYINYNCSGVLNIKQKENYLSPNFILSGDYSFTATNPTDPTDVIVVTNGSFKLVYVYF